MRRLAVVLGLAVALMAGTIHPASASDADSPSAARTHMSGGCVHNLDTHVLDCIKGWHKFTKTVDGKSKAFWEPVISAQRCKASGCWGQIWSGTQPRKYKLGSKGVRAGFSSSLARAGTGCGGVFSPWAICWFNRELNDAVQAVNTHVINPCVFGSAKGFAGIAITNLTVKAALRGGALTAAQGARAASYLTGPVGIGIISVATCGVGVAENGISNVEDLFK